MIDVPYLYTTLYAFEIMLHYENKRSINVNDLIKYRENILNNILDDYYEKEDHYTQPKDEVIGDLSFNDVDDLEEINYLIEEYPHMFYKVDDKLCIYQNVELEDIKKLKEEVEILPTRFHNAINRKDIFDLLGIKKIYEVKERIEKIGKKLEQQIEKEYMTNPSSPKIKQLLYKRFVFLLNVVANNKLYVDEFLNLPTNDIVYIDEDYDYYQESPYIKNNEQYPIDNELYQNSEYYEDQLEAMNPIQQNIEDSYHYAIFGSKPIYDYKYNDYISDMYMFNNFKNIEKPNIETEEYEEIEDIDISEIPNLYQVNFDIDEEEFAFYIIYIQKLNELINNGCYELTNVKNRLLYLLDNINHCLYDESKFKEAYNKALNYELEEDSFEFFENEALYYIEDIFKGKAGKILEKLVFVSTYYTLTKKEEIKEILSNYKGYPNYEFYSEIILGESLGYTLKKYKK